MNFIDLTGQRYGRLTLLRVHSRRNKRIFWECICDCGNTKVINAHSIRRGLSRSCGCLHKETSRENGKKGTLALFSGQSSFNALLSSYRKGAIKRGHAFELSEEQFKSITLSDCFYCDTPPSMEYRCRGKNKGTPYIYNGVDRVDNKEGYTINNSVPCCWNCNSSKGHVTVGIMEKALSFLHKTSI